MSVVQEQVPIDSLHADEEKQNKQPTKSEKQAIKAEKQAIKAEKRALKQKEKEKKKEEKQQQKATKKTKNKGNELVNASSVDGETDYLEQTRVDVDTDGDLRGWCTRCSCSGYRGNRTCKECKHHSALHVPTGSRDKKREFRGECSQCQCFGFQYNIVGKIKRRKQDECVLCHHSYLLHRVKSSQELLDVLVRCVGKRTDPLLKPLENMRNESQQKESQEGGSFQDQNGQNK